ncbi:MAG: T9SS type A sorting domain-containing protein [candidate division Zixibacteria bacterium]|nr:T9SS type A sorting domain-containing protein [candidate division Zixibacteria bacterium]
MDAITNGTYVQNEAWLKLNLAGLSTVDLTFYWKEHSDETHTQDGVYLSDNGGSSFVKVYNLTGGSSTYQQISLDIDALAASNSLSLTGTFVVKFQQYDNYGLTTDGMTFDDISVTGSTVSGFASVTSIPDVFSVSQNYPNPFNPVTSIDFSLPEASQVKIVVFNVLGQTISTLTDRYYEAGTHNVVWDGGTHASGIYLYRIQAGTNIETKKMLLLK